MNWPLLVAIAALVLFLVKPYERGAFNYRQRVLLVEPPGGVTERNPLAQRVDAHGGSTSSFGGRYGQGRGGDTFPLHPSFTNREVPGVPIALASPADTSPASASPTARCEATGVGRTAPVAPTKRPT